MMKAFGGRGILAGLLDGDEVLTSSAGGVGTDEMVLDGEVAVAACMRTGSWPAT